jgi:hypothetical protein
MQRTGYDRRLLRGRVRKNRIHIRPNRAAGPKARVKPA